MCPTNLMASFGRAGLLAEAEAVASERYVQAHFLVVDDIASMRRVIGSLLKEQLRDIRISEAADGKSALQLLRAAEADGRPFDFVVTDWNMPHMDGISLLRAIREEVPLQRLPVLLVTAEATREMILTAAKAGADGYIVKPFNADTLKLKLQQIMAKRYH
ncbi:MAG TPA: response regulator [Noviherbaspirillum sp.]|uniref:response regulator n=1 Tax=Noviherbaspirillum sp. TaxID=1926288 RepID=UPI002D3AFABE|nr:response regulator [Noviherbaspirillum sp.]HYD94158.1 response regulator [Noviherbaspirillum sp.]